MTDTTEPALLPCPFCLSAEYVGVVEESPTGPWWAGCGACAMQGPVSAESAEDARRLWNTRAAPEGPVVYIPRERLWDDHSSATWLFGDQPTETSPGQFVGVGFIVPHELAVALDLVPGERARVRLVREAE